MECRYQPHRTGLTEYICPECGHTIFSASPADQLHHTCPVAERRIKNAVGTAKQVAAARDPLARLLAGLRGRHDPDTHRPWANVERLARHVVAKQLWKGCAEKMPAVMQLLLTPGDWPQPWGPYPRSRPQGGKPRLGIMTPVLAYGGTERWIVELIQSIRETWDIEVGVLRNVDTSPEGAVAAIRELCPVSFLSAPAFPDWCQEFDVLKAWGLDSLPALVKGYRGAVIATSHGEDSVYTKRWVDKARAGATHWVAVSKAACAPLADVPQDRVAIIHNAVDAARCQPTRPREETRAALGFQPDEYVVGYLGRLSREKCVPVIADAVGLLGGEYRGLIVGDGNQLRKINWHEGRVVIRPHAFHVGDVLAATDCLVGLCEHEGFWRVGIEAALAGVPLISTRVGVLREIAEERGVLWQEVAAGVDAAGVAAAVRALRFDPQTADRAARLREVAATYSMERFARGWLDYLKRCQSYERIV